jgi:hypothetical protein
MIALTDYLLKKGDFAGSGQEISPLVVGSNLSRPTTLPFT